MNLLLVMNKREREGRIMRKIAHWAKTFDPAAVIRLVHYSKPGMLQEVLAFNPHVMLLFPLTSTGTSRLPTILKAACGTTVVTLETEGGTGYDTSHAYLKQFVGYDRYSSELVDYSLYWGSHDARHIGGLFLEEGKIAGPERNLTFGYPLYEVYASQDLLSREQDRLSPAIQEKLDKYPDDKRLLFVTGFHTADYTPEDCVNAADLFDTESDYTKELETVLVRVAREKLRRDQWIQAIRALAERRPDIQCVIKTHPIEIALKKARGANHYDALAALPNVALVSDIDATVCQLLGRSKALVHYGSTVVAESYLLNRASIFVFCPLLHGAYEGYFRQGRDPKGWPSTHAVTINGLGAVVDALLETPGTHCPRPAGADTVLLDFFNLTDPADYLPSRDIAAFLVTLAGKGQKLSPTDDLALQQVLGNFNRILETLSFHALRALKGPQPDELARIAQRMSDLGKLSLSLTAQSQLQTVSARLSQRCLEIGEQEAQNAPQARSVWLALANAFLDVAS